MQEALECTEQSSCRQSWRASESRVVVLQQANQNKALHTESQSLNRVLLRANTNHESKLRFASELLLYLTTLTEFIFGCCQPVFIFSCLVTVSRSVCFYTPLFRVQSQPATNEMASVVRASLRSSVVHTDRSTAWTQRLRLPLPAPASITADSPSDRHAHPAQADNRAEPETKPVAPATAISPQAFVVGMRERDCDRHVPGRRVNRSTACVSARVLS